LLRAAHLLPVLCDVVSQPRQRVGELAHSISRQACQQPSQLLAEAAHHQALKTQAGETTTMAAVVSASSLCTSTFNSKYAACLDALHMPVNVRCLHPPLIHKCLQSSATSNDDMWQDYCC
jgi:hypothetical protein